MLNENINAHQEQYDDYEYSIEENNQDHSSYYDHVDKDFDLNEDNFPQAPDYDNIENEYIQHLQEEETEKHNDLNEDFDENSDNQESQNFKNHQLSTSKDKKTKPIIFNNTSICQLRENIDFKIPFNRQENSKVKNAKIVLNDYLEDIPQLSADDWQQISDDLKSNDPLTNKVSSKKVYKIGLSKILMNYAFKYSWKFAKEGYSFYVYNNCFWIKVNLDLVKEFLKFTALKTNIPELFSLDYDFINTIYTQFMQASFIETMEHPKETLLNLKNGTLKINSNGIELVNSHPSDYLTYQLDYEYNPRAVNHLFISFLDEILPDKETQKTLQQALANLFIQDLKLEKIPFLYGPGGNGKSVIFEVLNGIVDSSLTTHYSLESLVDSKGYHRADLHKKLWNYASDISMRKINHGSFKQLVSGEPIEARLPFRKPFIMKNYAKLIFNINKIDDADIENTIGFFRRMIFIPFEQTIPSYRQDKDLHKKILQDKAGILNWILEGINEVLIKQEIFISKRCHAFLDKFMQESNVIIRFKNEYSLVKSQNDIIKFQPMYNMFLTFCKKQGEKPIPQRIFNAELRKYFDSDRKSPGYVWFCKATIPINL